MGFHHFPDEAQAPVVREIYAWYATEGRSLCGLAEHLQRQGIPTLAAFAVTVDGEERLVIAQDTGGAIRSPRATRRPLLRQLLPLSTIPQSRSRLQTSQLW